MKVRFFLFLLSALMVASCSSSGGEDGKSAGEIIDDYVDTLVDAPKKAGEARRAVEARQKLTEAEERALRELDQ